MSSWFLDDAEKRTKEAKYTFYRPSFKVLSQLRKDNFVKLIFCFDSENLEDPRAERMWVRITERLGDKFKGVLDNAPYFIQDLKLGDEIFFDESNIIDTDLEDSEENLVEKFTDRCFVSKKIIEEGQMIGRLYREESSENDTGWVIMAGNENQEYVDDPDNFLFISLGKVLNHDDRILEFLEASEGSEFQWNESIKNFEKI